MGKTVAMHRMMWETAQADDPVVPILIQLLFFQGDLIEPVRVALSETGELYFDDVKTLRTFLRETRCLIMFDGLNEVPGQWRERAVEAVAHFLREFPKHRYVVTSRSQDELWKKLRTGEAIVDAVVIQRITDEQARNYLIAHLGDRKGRDLHDRLNECLRGLSRTPLLLWMIKEAGLEGKELPGNRGELFDLFVNRMLTRDEKLELTLPWWAKRRAVAHLAFSLQQTHQLACEREHAIEIVAKSKINYDAEGILKEALFVFNATSAPPLVVLRASDTVFLEIIQDYADQGLRRLVSTLNARELFKMPGKTIENDLSHYLENQLVGIGLVPLSKEGVMIKEIIPHKEFQRTVSLPEQFGEIIRQQEIQLGVLEDLLTHVQILPTLPVTPTDLLSE